MKSKPWHVWLESKKFQMRKSFRSFRKTSFRDTVSRIRLFKGRIGTTRYLLGLAVLQIIGIILGVIVLSVLISNASQIINLLVFLLGITLAAPLLLFQISLTARRLHDIGWSGWFALIMLVPYLNIGLFLFLVFWEGQSKPNMFGIEPSRRKVHFMKDILHIDVDEKNQNTELDDLNKSE